MSAWRIQSEELRRRRIEKMLDRAELARITGVSVRTLALLEASDKGVTVTTLDALIKPLGCKRVDVATYVDPRKKSAPVKVNGAPRASNDRPRIIDLRTIQRALPDPEPVLVDGELVPMLTVLRFQQCFTAYLARDGERYCVEGRVHDERGLPPSEAALLGATSGEAARFEIHCPVGDAGHTLCVTVHTSNAETTLAMQRAADKTVLCVVRVVAFRDLAPNAGLAFSMRERPSPWGFVVERVISVKAPESRAQLRSPKRARRRSRVAHETE